MRLFCKYCCRHRRIQQEKGDIIYAEIKKNKLKLIADVYGLRTREIPINYCPKCRKKVR